MKKILIVNKFLYPNGGSEKYIFELGKQLEKDGFEISYFGMQDERNVVGNKLQMYTRNFDFHTGRLKKLLYPFQIIYSVDARRKIRKILENQGTDIVHLNNFNYQITPSIIWEIRKYEKRAGKKVTILYTAHDYQLICPNHMMRNLKENCNCDKCIMEGYQNCVKNRCMHSSAAKSILGALEGWIYRKLHVYKYIDTVICPSTFMKTQLDKHPDLSGKTVVLQNFADEIQQRENSNIKKDYVLYFGRYAEEKGIRTLLSACKELPHISFVFAGSGNLEKEMEGISNICNKGFMTGENLLKLIKEAAFSICPSEWYENCPFSVMESIQLGTKVLGADIGGIPELIENGNGLLFESGNVADLKNKILQLYENREKSQYNLQHSFMTVEGYSKKLVQYMQ